MDVSIVISGSTALGILALIGERIWNAKHSNSSQKKNGETLESIRTFVSNVYNKTKKIEETSNNTASDIKVMKSELQGFQNLCEEHRKSQGDLNKTFNNKLKCLDDRVFDIATKEKG